MGNTGLNFVGDRKAKTEPTWRFWALYVHVCKRETLEEAYRQAKANDELRD